MVKIRNDCLESLDICEEAFSSFAEGRLDSGLLMFPSAGGVDSEEETFAALQWEYYMVEMGMRTRCEC